MDSEKLKKIAIKVLEKSKMPKEDSYGFALVTILMMISIMLTCVRILQECNKNKLSKDPSAQDKYAIYGADIKEYASRRGWFTKMRIKKIIRRELSKEDYEKYSFNLLNAILEIGENLKDDEIITLVEASNV